MIQRPPLAGVIGSPIGHSKSPRLHNFWLKRYGIDGFYIPMEIAPEHLGKAMRMLPKFGFVGLNVTIPHKEKVLALADEVTDTARRIGAANTLVFGENGKIHADNTDGYGFMTNLRHGAPDWDPASGPAAVLGAGGASRAVIVSLLDAGVPEIRLSNRTRGRAETLAAEFGDKIKVQDWADAGDMLAGAALLVNTTSLGMVGKKPLNIVLDDLSPDTVVTDLVYTPLRTELLIEAEEIGCKTVDGLGMLEHQATPGFERWFGVKPEVDEKARAVLLGA
ncbi:shikimate dehydrogenase [Actibacterium sp. XHP0104]|uniref:shikimate dehydrogenase n=1 Tax=Actibacterium sp. XHP0104 TaxID=2984335 RepID=UPI0021E8936E|nr:shikimate dehydrogenase [Actibacterium sp. XHP0104]MCV2882106.1 shikimate dehydrogenase [Actibacterium sp. XHP0104]